MFSFDSVTVGEEHTYRNIDYIWFYIYIKHNHSLLYIFNMSSFDHWYMVSFFKFLVLKTTAWDGLNDNYVYVDIHINVDCISLSRNWTEPKPKCLKSNRTETEGISGMFNRTEPNRYKQKLNRTEPNRNPRRFDKLRFEPIGSVRFGSVRFMNRTAPISAFKAGKKFKQKRRTVRYSNDRGVNFYHWSKIKKKGRNILLNGCY